MYGRGLGIHKVASLVVSQLGRRVSQDSARNVQEEIGDVKGDGELSVSALLCEILFFGDGEREWKEFGR